MNPGFFLSSTIIAYTFAFMSWSINSARSANYTYNDDLYNELILNYVLNARMIELRLSYVPVTKPRRPISTIKMSFDIVKGLRDAFCQHTTISMIGGNTKARAVLLTAPTNDMNRPSWGIASARMNVRKQTAERKTVSAITGHWKGPNWLTIFGQMIAMGT